MFNQSFEKLKNMPLTTMQIGMLLGLMGYTAFAFSDAFAKWMAQGYSVYQVIAMSNLCACILLLCLLPKMGGMKTLLGVKRKRIHAMRSVLNVSISLMIVHSFKTFSLPIADVYTFIFAMPIYAALISIPLYGEHITRNRLITILIGFAGVVIALQPGTSGFDPALIWPLICGVVIALMFTLAKSMPEEKLFSIGFWPMLTNVLVCGAYALFTGDIQPMPIGDIGMFAAHGAFIMLGILGVSNAFRYAPSAAVAPILYTEMIWAIILGYILFDDVPDAMMMVGAGVIVLSGCYLIISERREKRRSAENAKALL